MNNDVVGKIQGENSKINLIASAIGALVPRRFRLARKPANRAYAEIIGWPLSSHAKPLIPGAGRFTRRCYPEIHTPNSTPKQLRKSKKKFSVTAYVDNNCSGSLPALD